MTLAELIPAIDALPRSEKLALIQRLASDIAQQEKLARELAGKTIPMTWPNDSFEGAAALMQLLEQEKQTP